MNTSIIGISGSQSLCVKALVYAVSAERLPIYASGESVKEELSKRQMEFADFDSLFQRETQDPMHFFDSLYNCVLVCSSDSDWYNARRTVTKRNRIFTWLTVQMRRRDVTFLYDIPEGFKVDKRIARGTSCRVDVKELKSGALSIKVQNRYNKGGIKI